MLVEKPRRFEIGPCVLRGVGLTVGALVPVAMGLLYHQGLSKELARQTALQMDVRCGKDVATEGPWQAACRQAIAEVQASRVAGWEARSRD